MSEHDERFRDDCGAYVLGALEAREAAALREHMRSCALCREEVERLAAVSEVLGLGVPAFAAPAELRARVLDTVRDEAALFEAAATPRSAAPTRRLWAPRPLAGLLGAALALGVLLGALVVAPGGSSGSKVITATVAPASRWHSTRAPKASLRESGTQGELVLSGLPAAPRGRIYEVWIRRGTRAQPTSVLFDATAGGRATVAVPDLAGANAVMVTAERLGGVNAPTMKPLVLAALR